MATEVGVMKEMLFSQTRYYESMNGVPGNIRCQGWVKLQPGSQASPFSICHGEWMSSQAGA